MTDKADQMKTTSKNDLALFTWLYSILYLKQDLEEKRINHHFTIFFPGCILILVLFIQFPMKPINSEVVFRCSGPRRLSHLFVNSAVDQLPGSDVGSAGGRHQSLYLFFLKGGYP